MPTYNNKELVIEPFIIGAIAIMLLVPGVVLTTQQNAFGYVLIVISVPFVFISLADAVGFVYLLFKKHLQAPPALSDYDGKVGSTAQVFSDVTQMMDPEKKPKRASPSDRTRWRTHRGQTIR